jgi:hypothetical protein
MSNNNDFETLREHFQNSRIAAASVENIFNEFDSKKREVQQLEASLERLQSLRSTDAESAQSALSVARAESAAALEREVQLRHRAADCIESVKQEVEEELWRIASRLHDHER